MSNDNQVDRSEAGIPIIRHERSQERIEPPIEINKNRQLLEDHVHRHFGNAGFIWHEIASETVHIDIYVVEPTTAYPFYTLVTMGMSDLPMKTSDPRFQYAELVMCLPTTWPIKNLLDRKQLQVSNTKSIGQRFLLGLFPDTETWYWPVRCLKSLARLPHEYKTSLGVGHTVPNGGENPKPYASNTRLCCAFIAPPTPLIPDEFVRLEINQSEIWFLSVMPIYREEMNLRLKRGTPALLEKLEKANVSELVDIKRKNVAF